MKKFILILCAVIIIAGGVCFYLWNNGQFKPAHGYIEPKDNQIRVACVGDSVTYGMTMKNWSKNAYPFVLRQMLGENYCTENFGFSGRTVMLSGDRPYMKEKLYEQSLDFNPDIVILQIGSNDSKSYNWKGVDEFKADYEKLLESYISLESKPRVIVCTPPPAFEYKGKVKYDIEAQTISEEIAPTVLEIAEKYNLEVINLMSVFDSCPGLFNDGLHPNEEGALEFAKEVYNLIGK